MSPSLRSSSLGLLFLLVISFIIPFTAALSGNLQLRQDAKLPKLLDFVPDCAKQCVYAKIAPMSCVGDQAESCLCGDDPQNFKNSIWKCIDGDCGGGESDSHQSARTSLEGLCVASVSTTSATGSSASTQSTSDALAQMSSKSFQSSSATAEAYVSSFTEGAVSKSEAVPVSTTVVPEGVDANKEVRKSHGLSAPAVICISIGSFIFLTTVVGLLYYAFARRRKNHRKHIQSMTLESDSPRGGATLGNKANQGALGTGIWMSISNSSSTLAGSYYSSNQPVPPIDTNVANEKPNAHRGPNISPMSPVSPIIPQGFEFEESVQGKVVESRKIIENPHLFVPPTVTYMPANPIEAIGRIASPIPPILASYRPRSTSNFSNHSYDGDLPGMAISTDLPVASPTLLGNSSTSRHPCSTIATMRRHDHPSDPLIPSSPPPEYVPSSLSESSESTRSSLQSSHSLQAGGISRSDTLSWRRELERAAGCAVTRVLHSEQSVNEEMDAAKRRKGSIPGLKRFSRRLSRDHRADEENLVDSEKSPGFWGRFGSKSSQNSQSLGSPPRPFMSKRLNSGGSARSRTEQSV